MRALVFGGSGFLGGYLVDYLQDMEDRKYWQYENYDVFPYIGNWHFCNVKEKEDLNHIDFNVDVVFDFVSISDIQECLDNPGRAIETNINGTVNLLEKARTEAISPIFVFASSMYVHNDISGIYGITKRTCEEIIKFYHKLYGIPYVILRYGTIYGPRSPKTNSINKIISEALKTKTISYYGTGEEIREYIHVKDVVKITIELLEERYLNNTYEITGLNPIKAKDMVRTIRDILGREYKEEFRNEQIFNHYNITPYAFQPDISQKYISDTYYSFGAGLLEVVQELNNKIGE